MRNLKNFMLLLITVSLVTLSGCSSDDNGGGGSAAQGTITAKIDGASFTSIDIASMASLVAASNTLTLQGNDANGNSIIMVINGYNGTGTYNFDGNSIPLNIASYLEIDINNPTNVETWTAPYQAALNGSVTITQESDDNIQGTFEFTGQNANDMSTKAITNGSFSLDKQTF